MDPVAQVDVSGTCRTEHGCIAPRATLVRVGSGILSHSRISLHLGEPQGDALTCDARDDHGAEKSWGNHLGVGAQQRCPFGIAHAPDCAPSLPECHTAEPQDAPP
jgi:hypothetical protein